MDTPGEKKSWMWPIASNLLPFAIVAGWAWLDEGRYVPSRAIPLIAGAWLFLGLVNFQYLVVCGWAGRSLRRPADAREGIRRGMIVAPVVFLTGIGVFYLWYFCERLIWDVPGTNRRYGWPHWLSEAIMFVPAAVVLLAFAGVTAWVGRGGGRWRSLWPLRCVGCGYALVQPATPDCPECGRSVASARAGQVWPWPAVSPRRPFGRSRGTFWWEAVCRPRGVGERLANSELPAGRWVIGQLLTCGVVLLLVCAGFAWLHKLSIARGWMDYFDRDTARRFIWWHDGIEWGVTLGLGAGAAALMLVYFCTGLSSRVLAKRHQTSPERTAPAAAVLVTSGWGWCAIWVAGLWGLGYGVDLLAIREPSSAGFIVLGILVVSAVCLVGYVRGLFTMMRGLSESIEDSAHAGSTNTSTWPGSSAPSTIT